MKALASLAHAIDRLNQIVGRSVAWLALGMVLVQFIVVVMRYVFGIGSIAMQESIIYMHGAVFLLAAGYTLWRGGHVRVDIFYRGASATKKAIVDLLGVIFLLIPVITTIWLVSWPYVSQSWAVREGSQETSGIQAVFLLKTFILIFSILVLLQGISLAAHSILILAGLEKPEPENGSEAA